MVTGAKQRTEGSTVIAILCAGKLVSDPKPRVGPSGKPFTTVNVRCPVSGEDDDVLVSGIAFGSVAEALARLKAGDTVALQGAAKLNHWVKDGEPRTGLSMVADAVLSPYQLLQRRPVAE